MRMSYLLAGLLTGILITAGTVTATGQSPENIEQVTGIRIAWDYSSMQKLAPLGDRQLRWVGYPRVRRLADGSLMAVYETGSEVEMVRSYDNGKTWDKPVVLFAQLPVVGNNDKSAVIRAANSEFYQLRNGIIMAACNYRPSKNEIAPFSIAVKRSTDNGATWGATQIIYEAEPRFTDGCWEPAFLQLPDGELQVYFANEAPYTTSDEQEISMLSSFDDGLTWNDVPKTVSFRKDRRDGMPAPLLLDDEILVAIEDNKTDPFKPYIVRTSVSGNWRNPVTAESENREYALADSLPDDVYAGAPYLMRVPTGEVILSYQTTSGRSDEWENSTLEVGIGDKRGRNFTKLTRPFDVPINREAKWNSISLWDENTVVAAATTSFRSPRCEVWIIRGNIITEPQLTYKKVEVDGILDEWPEKHQIFIGSRSETNLAASLYRDNNNFYFCASVNDTMLIYNQDNIESGDGVVFYVKPLSNLINSGNSAKLKIWCSYKGDVKLYRKAGTNWNEINNNSLVVKSVATEGEGYRLEVAVPYNLWDEIPESGINFTMGLSEQNSKGTGYTEYVIHSNPETPQTWFEIPFIK